MNPIKKVTGPCIVLAGAGTGKTFTIVEKVKYLVEKEIYSPEKIVCITFSNEAANNLYSRIKPLVGEKEPIVKTFHSFSADLLREYGEKIEVKKDFSVLTPEDAKIVLHKYFRVSPHYCHKYIETIGTAKDLGISVGEIENYLKKKIDIDDLSVDELDKKFNGIQLELENLSLDGDKEKRKFFGERMKEFNNLKELRNFISTWKAFEKIKTRNNYQDYSDLNNNALKLLDENPEIADEFDYVIVDEFQDTNKVQLDFLFALARKGNITIVGDLNQSIYRFRGAYRENFNLFREHFGVSRNEIFNLDKSYRSSNKILGVAHKLILNNYENKSDCFEVFNVDNLDGGDVEVYELKNGKEEARKIVELVESEVASGKKYEDICIMFRTHQQGRLIKNYFEFKGIEFSSVTKKSLFKQKKVKMAMDFLKILYYLKERQRGGEQAWWDLIYQLGFHEEDLIVLGKFIRKHQRSEFLSEIIFNEICSLQLSERGSVLARALVEQLKVLLPESDKKVSEILRRVYGVAGLNFDSGNQDILDLNKFYDLALNQTAIHYGDLGNFVHYLEILDNLKIDISVSDVGDGGVRLMTSHATKGLEFDTVIISNFAQKKFPIERVTRNSLLPLEVHPELSDLVGLSAEDVENEIREYQRHHQLLEERRLAYVSFTRAKEKLILTYAKEYGKKKIFPSQFLKEIDYQGNTSVKFLIDECENYEEPEIKIKSRGKRFDKIDFENGLSVSDVGEGVGKKKIRTLSPSSLLLFKRCQKEFEYKYVYNMPEPKPVNWEEMKLGSFLHFVLEKGVYYGFKEEREFVDLAKSLHREKDWESVDLNEAEHLVRVFYYRNQRKFNSQSKTEQKLRVKLGGLNFIGFADRIDFSPRGMEIIDYKTGKSQVPVLSRNWQLGYYALAASKIGKVHKITLDMLRHEKPLEFEIDEKGIARCVNSERTWFDLNEVEQELVFTAQEIEKAYQDGFKACARDKNCEFCDEWVYGD